MPTIEALNAAGLDVSSVGNHEFDQGFADLTDRVMPLAALGVPRRQRLRQGHRPTPALPEYYTKTFDGVTIGFVGAVTDELPSLVSPAGIADHRRRRPDRGGQPRGRPAERRQRRERRGRHRRPARPRGRGDDRRVVGDRPELARSARSCIGANDNVDAIVSGHTHLAYNHVIDGRPVISSGQYGERFSQDGHPVRQVDQDRSPMKNEIFNLMDGADCRSYPRRPGGRRRSSPTRRRAVGQRARQRRARHTRPPTSAAPSASNPVGAAVVPREPRRRVDARQLRRRRAAVVAQRGRHAATCDIAFMNPGGLRADLDARATVTYREAANVQPFANTLVTLDAHRRADQAGARAAVAAGRRVASVPQARRQQGAHVHVRPDAPRRDRTSPRSC